MNSAQVNVNVVLSGTFKGTADNPVRRSPLSLTAQQAMTQGGTGAGLLNAAIDWTVQDSTLAGSATVNLNLQNPGTTYLNPLGEQMTTTAGTSFGKVRVIRFTHNSQSTATTGLRLFAATTNTFSGLLAAGNSLTLKPGESITIESYTAAGMAVDASHNLFTFANLDSVSAQYRFFIGGSTS